MAIARINFKLYKALALINIRYDNVSYKEGQELEIRESDIEEMTEKQYVEMIEVPEVEQITSSTNNDEIIKELEAEAALKAKAEGEGGE
jgi:hypothetical protein